MLQRLEIDLEELSGGRFALAINGERFLLSESMGEIIDRVEKEAKKHFNIKSSKFKGMFGR